jgi:iron complex outermembrane receptor protein
MNLATITYETKLHLPVGAGSEYIFGFQGMNQENTNLNDRETKLLPDATTDNYSIFAVLNQTFTEKLNVQTGIRYDKKNLISVALGQSEDYDFRPALDKNYGSFSGSAGATYNMSERLLFRANIAAAYRTPNLAELTSNGQHETRYEIGDENLVPENSFEFDLSTHYHINNLTFDLAGFYNKINHYIFIAPTGDTSLSGISVFQYTQRDAYLFGGEAGIHFHPELLKWLHLAGTFSTVTGKQNDGNNLPFIPANKLNFEIRFMKEKLAFLNKPFFTINSQTAFNKDDVATDETITEAYTLIDFSIGGNFNIKNQSVSIGISANNLFDTQYTDHLSTLKEVNLFNPGRNFTFSLKIPFGLYMEK